MDEPSRLAAGVHEGVLRLSVGIEHVDDLSADLACALARAEDVACVAV